MAEMRAMLDTTNDAPGAIALVPDGVEQAPSGDKKAVAEFIERLGERE